MNDNVHRLPIKQRRLNININTQTEMYLQAYAEQYGVSVTEAVRRLVGIGGWIADEMRDGKEVLLRKDGQVERVMFDV